MVAFFGVIALLSAATVAFFFINQRVIDEYRSITDVMTTEYTLVNTTSTLVEAFNTRMQSAGTDSTKSQAAIDDSKKSIAELTAFLDASITDTDSRSSYLGFKASIDNFIIQIDDSLKRFEGGNIQNYYTDFNEANKLYGFVKENGTSLLFSELHYATILRDSIRRTYFLTLLFGTGTFVALLLVCAVFVLQFATRLILPLRRLAVIAEKVAAGDTSAVIDDSLRAGSDEIGSLARSLHTMLLILFKNISTLDASNRKIAESSHVLESKNEELGRLNTLMIDRELKMVELKKQNEALRIQLREKMHE